MSLAIYNYLALYDNDVCIRPLFNDELLIGLVEQQCRERPRRFHLIEQIQFLGEGVTDTRGKAEAEQRCKDKHLFRAAPSIRVMLANMQITFVMAKRVDHIQCLLVRPDDLRLAKGDPDISRMGIDAIFSIFWQRFLPISWQQLETRSGFALMG